MDEMLGRAAKAICQQRDEAWDEILPYERAIYHFEAKAALDTLRTPTDAVAIAIAQEASCELGQPLTDEYALLLGRKLCNVLVDEILSTTEKAAGE